MYYISCLDCLSSSRSYVIALPVVVFSRPWTRWSRSTSNFYALIGQNLIGEFMRKIHAASWNLFTVTAEADRVLCQLVMFLTTVNCLFLLDERNEIQLLSRVFCYSWLVCLLGFWFRNTWPVKVGNPISDGIDSFSFITLLDWKVWSDVASRSCLSNYCICVCFFYISNFMKPSAVYEAIVYACLN